MSRLGINVITHIITISLMMMIFAAFDFNVATIPMWVLPVTFILGGLTWSIIDEVDKIYED